MQELQAIVRHLNAAPPAGDVLATLVSVAGSSYRRPGARLLLTASGERLGSISGGCLEEDVLARARQVRETGKAQLVTYDTTSENDLIWGVGLGCHGVVQVLIERLSGPRAWISALDANLRSHRATPLVVVWQAADPSSLGTFLAEALAPLPQTSTAFADTIAPPVPLFVYGAGDDARPLVRFARELGWRVTVADPRPGFVTVQRFPSADVCVCAPAGELVSRTAPPSDAIAVVMTHHYVHDVPILGALLSRDAHYIGLLGPKKRAERILADLSRNGLPPTPAARERLHAPVGLDLGAETPEEVALSIIAEIKASLAQRDARPLRDRRKPIHG